MKKKKIFLILGISFASLFVIVLFLFCYKELFKKIEYNKIDKYLLANEYIKHSFYQHDIWKGYNYYYKGECEDDDWKKCTKVYPFTLKVEYNDVAYSETSKQDCNYDYNYLTNYGNGSCMIDGILTNFSYDFNNGIYSSKSINFNTYKYEDDRSQY